MKHLKIFLAIEITLCILSGCKGDPVQSGPKESELRLHLATSLPAYLSVSDFHVEASQNIGNQIQPIYKSKFKASVTINTDTYREVEKINEDIIIALVKQKGSTIDVYGTITSVYTSGSWTNEIILENDPVILVGNPRDFYPAGTAHLLGSPEERALREQIRPIEFQRKSLTVPSAKPWSTEVKLAAGSYHITSSGRVNASADSNDQAFRWVTPEGWVSSANTLGEFLVPSAPYMSLVGKLDSESFLIGTDYFLTVKKDCNLYFSVNEISTDENGNVGNDIWSNNQGQFRVEIVQSQ